MTRDDFLMWLDQFRHVANIRSVVQSRKWAEPELDRLKENLESGGRLQMKTDAKRKARMGWG